MWPADPATQIDLMVGDHGYDVRADMDLDSDVDATESSVQSSDSGQSLGLGNLSRDPTLSGGVGNRVGYAGYQWDPEASKFHVRHRVKDPLTGRWMRRDPIDLPPRFIPPTELV